MTTTHCRRLNLFVKSVVCFPRQQIEEYFVPLVRTLSQADWFTSRSAATGLYAVMYDRVNSSIQDHLRQWFAQLCQDDTPMVRREAATNLKVFTLLFQTYFSGHYSASSEETC